MYADERIRVEPRLHRRHRISHEVALAARVYAHVIAIGADPVDVRDIDEYHAIAITHDDPAARCGGRSIQSFGAGRRTLIRVKRGPDVVHQCREPARDTAFLTLHYAPTRAIDGRREAVVVDRLEQVVECVRLEGAERMRVERRHE